MDLNPVAEELIVAIEKYKVKSSKKDYIFNFKEQVELQNAIEILNKHLELLLDYEIKRNKEGKN